MTQLAHNLKSKRIELGWSQERAANEISIAYGKRIDKTVYQAWEAGRRVPNINILIKLVEVLKIDDLYLFITKTTNV